MHISKEDIRRYVKGETVPDEMKQMEEHLFLCDACLQEYLEIVEQDVHVEIDDCPDALVTSVLQDVNGISQSFEKVYRKREKKQTMKHYIIAASITLVFLTSGLFESVVSTFSTVEQKINNNEPIALEVVDEMKEVLLSLKGGK
ncbi:anti-sigma factor [Massilibacterium senegalense]|uniref:hypothetical protein n=1 Tax=Massilibacterium senegalense TaxID=1632858 RepID=UPI000780C380|nr:hypothetical protein [Massilibacterium senegalense]